MNFISDFTWVISVAAWVSLASLKTIPLILMLMMLLRYGRNLLSASARYWLWIPVLISLSIPLGWQLSFSASSPSLVSDSINRVSAIEAENLQSTSVLLQQVSGSNTEEKIHQSISSQTIISVLVTNLPQVLTVIWLFGVVLLLVVTLVKAKQYSHLKKSLVVTSPEIAQLFEACCKKLAINQSVILGVSANINTPIVMGWLRPVIIIPTSLAENFHQDMLGYVLLHELGHVKRKDILFNWIVGLINIMHWFNPIVWFACRRMRTDMEAACDALVLTHLHKAEYKSYGETLIELSDFIPYSSRRLTAVGILENHYELKERLKMIKQVTVMNLKHVVLFGVILVCTAVTAFAQPAYKDAVKNDGLAAQKMTLEAFAFMVEKALHSKVMVNSKDSDIPVRIRVDINALDYSSLLTQLKQNGFTAYQSNGDINFIEIREARNSAIPVVEKNKTYFDDEFVTDNITLEKACGNKLLPVLRPLVPRDGHMTTSESTNMIILVDTYSNIQRIKAIIKKIESDIEKPEACTK